MPQSYQRLLPESVLNCRMAMSQVAETFLAAVLSLVPPVKRCWPAIPLKEHQALVRSSPVLTVSHCQALAVWAAVVLLEPAAKPS